MDNTLYDWVTYFSTSFYAMVDVLATIVPVPREQLLDEFQSVHRRYANSEHPFAVLELECVRKHFDGKSSQEILAALDPALHAFSRARRATLQTYPGVTDTLNALQRAGVAVVGHTESIAINAFFRLELLGLTKYFTRLYALENPAEAHPKGQPATRQPPDGFVHFVPPAERKPNPALLVDICTREGAEVSHTWYVGDSLTRDMSMAKRAGVRAIWARYGSQYNREHWQRLVRITHWTADDVAREAELRKAFADVQPDDTLDTFGDLLDLPTPRS